jgi:protein-S-isoprenylcysteine O-methyltransferase Ste14
METNPTASTVARTTTRVMRFLTTPWVDRVLAVAAIVPFAYPIFTHFRGFGLNVPDVTYLIHILALVGTMVFRKAPVCVTPNPLFWLLALVATYWGFLAVSLEDPGRPLAPSWITNAIAIFSVAVMLWARISLGRNIGFVPAQRDIVTHGAYRYMRHPIYTALFIGVAADILEFYSPRNALIFTLGVFWFVLKSFVEESFLREDPQYATYMQRVRWRWLPGVA